MQRVEEGGWKDAYAWYWDAVNRWPDVFDQTMMRRLLISAEQRSGDDFFAFVPLLRTALLRQVYRAAQGCTPAGCGLHVNRLNNLPVLDDGDPEGDVFADELGEGKVPIGAVMAKIMIVGEGPGEYEQRTGLPLVSFQTLQGSRCLKSCGTYDKCYPFSKNADDLFQERRPQSPCRPVSLKKELKTKGVPDVEGELLQIQKARVERPFVRISTCGELLDLLFIGRDQESRGEDGPLLNWVWRRSWDGRQRLRGITEAREATVYTTNAIKCRRLADQHGSASPSPEQMDLCRRFLDMQVYIVQPKVVIALGKAAVYSLALQKDVKITSDEVWGQALPTPYGIPMLPAPHPSYPLRQQKTDFMSIYKTRLVKILQRARQIAEGEEELSRSLIDRQLQEAYEASQEAEAARPKTLEEIREECTNRDFWVEQDLPVPPPAPARNRFADVPVASPEQLAARKNREEAKLRPHVPDETSGLPGAPNLDPQVNPVALGEGSTFPADWEGPLEPPDEEEAIPVAMEA
jgi:uracil-DNA glycosylase family 4